jgi:hypothetical protein
VSDANRAPVDLTGIELLKFEAWQARYKNLQDSLFTTKEAVHLLQDDNASIFRRADWPEIGMPGEADRATYTSDCPPEEQTDSDIFFDELWSRWFEVLAARGTRQIVIADMKPPRPSKHSPIYVAGLCEFNRKCIRNAHRALVDWISLTPWVVYDCEGRWALYCDENNFSIFCAPAEVIAEIVNGCGGVERFQEEFVDKIYYRGQAPDGYLPIVDRVRWPKQVDGSNAI